MSRLLWFLAYRRTRDVEPAVGQEWARRDGYTLWVDGIYGNGRVGVTTKPPDYNPVMFVSWGESREDFRRRTNEQRFVLQGAVR